MNQTTKRILMIGVPAVGGLVLVMLLARRSSSSTTSSTTPTATTTTTAAGAAVGVGQLADFENSTGQQLTALSQQIGSLTSAVTTAATAGTTTATPLPTPTVTASPTPTPTVIDPSPYVPYTAPTPAVSVPNGAVTPGLVPTTTDPYPGINPGSWGVPASTTPAQTTSPKSAYYHVANPTQANALQSLGTQMYYQPAGAPAGTEIPIPTTPGRPWWQGLPKGATIMAKAG